jgi:hypothetical protein
MAWFFVAALISGTLWVWFRMRHGRLVPEADWIVTFDGQGVTVTSPKGDRQEAKWLSLSRIAIRTTDDGPWREDVFWGLHENGSAKARVVFPGGATGEQALIKELDKRLKGVGWDRFIQAMGSTSNAYFVVWQSGEDCDFIADPEPSETQRRIASVTEQLLLKLFRKQARGS